MRALAANAMRDKDGPALMFATGVPMPVLHFDLRKIDLPAWARATLGLDRLEDLHALPDPLVFANYVERLQYRVDQLKSEAGRIEGLLQEIKQDLLVPLVGEIARFQIPPSIRCHLAGAGTASAFHKDGDPKYGVSRNALNLWIPLTHCWGSNSIQIEETVDSGIFRTVELHPGDVLVFDAYHLTHGSVANTTGSSRVSLDIRFVPSDPAIAARLKLYATTG